MDDAMRERERRRKAQLRRKREKQRRQRMLLGLIGILAVLLVVILIIAAVLGGIGENPGPTDGSQGGTNSTSGTEQTRAPIELTVVSPKETNYSTMDKTVTFTGRSDPKDALTINGQQIDRDADGMFSVELSLSQGENIFTLVHRDQTVEYTVVQRYATEAYSPAKDMTYCADATVYLHVMAKEGSEVTVDFNGSDFELELCADQLGSGASEGFRLYEGTYKLPSPDADRDMGKITYTVTCDGITESFTSGNITCKAKVPVLDSDPSVTPAAGNYIDVGSGLIVEVVSRTAETLDGHTADDKSSPLNNYLPKGTVDYCDSEIVHNYSADQTYRILRCGYRMYEAKRNYPADERDQIIICYNGTLPDHNEVGFSSLTESGNFTILTLDSMWKAPFYFDMEPQTYANPETRDFTFAECTISYLDITFCYATSFAGQVQIPENHPLFSHAEVFRNEYDCTLRLHLKEVGGFYGWDSYYNENGQLCFKFLKPAQIAKADNAYGASLAGVTIMLDVGHGGVDSGTIGYTGGKGYSEASRNLELAFAVKEELESLGATVVMNREGNDPVTIEERLAYLKEVAPDYCMAIHHNASSVSGANGFEAFYFGPMSQLAAKHIFLTHRDGDAYNSSALMWHVYHLARQSNCPVVLTENGYMSNSDDMYNTVDEDAIEEKAKLLTQGVVNYFLDINGLYEE